MLDIFSELLPYDLVLIIGYIWFFIKYKNNYLLLLIVTLFFAGIFKDFGDILLYRILFSSNKHLNIGTVIFEIGTLILTIVIFLKYYQSLKLRKHNLLITIFIIYCVWFFVASVVINNDSVLLFTRELSKDLIPFLLFFIFAKIMQEPNNSETLKLLFFRLINAQILFSIAKLIILMDYHEGMVGSLTGISKGGPGTTLPLLGMIFIALNSKMILKRKDIWMIVGLLLTGILAGKRALLLLFPVLYVLLSIYVYRKKFGRNLIYVVILLPAIIYIGLRLMPTLNPENKIWGSFNPEYAWNYGVKYSTGKEDPSDEIEKGTGRLGALVLSLDLFTDNTISNEKIVFGHGLEYFSMAGDRYYDRDYWWGISGRGAITGILYKFFSIGLICTVLYVLYLLLFLSQVKNKRLRHTMILVVFFDFIFYNATIITLPSLFALLIFEMFYDTSMTRKNIRV